MRETGTLVKINGKMGLFELDVAGGCESCDIKHQCVSAGPGKRKIDLPLGSFDLEIGDQVYIETSPQSLLGAAFVVFMLPLMIAMGIYGICYYFTKRPGVSLLALFAGLGLAYFVISKIDRKWGRKKAFEPVVVGKIQRE